MLGVKPPAFGGRQAELGQREARERLERLTDRRQRARKPHGQRAERRGAPALGPQAFEGASEHLAAVDRAVGGAVGAHQCEAFVPPEAVRIDGLEHGELRVDVEPAERVGERDPERALVDAALQSRREAFGQHQALRDPVGPLAEHRGDRLRPGAVLPPHRSHNPRLVHRGDGAARRVGAQQHVLALDARAGALDYGRDGGLVVRPGSAHALEAVDHLEQPTLDGRDPHRHLDQAAGAAARSAAAAQLLEAGPQPIERHVEHDAGGADHDPPSRSGLKSGSVTTPAARGGPPAGSAST